MQQQLKIRAAIASIASNFVLLAMKLAFGMFMHSLSVISEAVHSGLDLIAAIIAFMSVRHSAKRADREDPFGHGKRKHITATIEAVLIFSAAIYIIYKAVLKLQRGNREVEALGMGAVVMGTSAAINYVVSRYMFKVARQTESAALQGVALHLRTDVWTSLGVFGGLITM